jgi:hypothetical protein
MTDYYSTEQPAHGWQAFPAAMAESTRDLIAKQIRSAAPGERARQARSEAPDADTRTTRTVKVHDFPSEVV